MEDEKKERETDENEEGVGRQELLGGFAVYGVLLLCAVISLIPLLVTEGLPLTRLPEGGLRNRIWGRSYLLDPAAVVVTFFALDEDLSRIQLDELTSICKEYPDRKIMIMAACASHKHPGAIEDFRKRRNAPFPIIHCPDKMAAQIVGGGSLPITIVRDDQGNLVRIFRRFAKSEEIIEEIRKILGEVKKRPTPLKPETST
jgi:hypothetical protein